MKKSFYAFYILLSLIVCGCNKNIITSQGGSNKGTNDSTSINDNSDKGANQKYITAKRVYDLEYNVNGYPEETMTLEEFPELTFKRDNSKVAFLIEGRDTVADSSRIGAKGIYLADVNSDGYTDLAYYQDRTKGSSNTSCLVRIYDYHNDKLIFDDDNHKNSILDLDEEGNAVIEEIAVGGGSLKELTQAGRFLKGSEISIEWYTFDFKLKSISLELNINKDGNYYAYLNKEITVLMRLYGIGSESLDKSIPIEQINIERDDESYLYEINTSSIASLFNITFRFLKTGSVELQVFIGNVMTSITIFVIEE